MSFPPQKSRSKPSILGEALKDALEDFAPETLVTSNEVSWAAHRLRRWPLPVHLFGNHSGGKHCRAALREPYWHACDLCVQPGSK